ncbi:MAG TPA: ribosome biogenesis GTPase YqeH [Bacillales bacterium]|nr:ribosome biogenesis GTPase YqeH [Bacillales bacterium]
MAKDKMICLGCGAAVQSEDPNGIGFVPVSALNREAVLCKRCFRLKHYGEVAHVPLGDDDYLKIIQDIADTDALIVNIVDIFDFTGSWLPGLRRLTGGNKVLLVGNKIDLLPKSTNATKLKHWLYRSSKELGRKVEDVFLISAQTGEGMDELAEAIERYRSGKDVYVVGCTNVGKSTFINRLLRQFAGIQSDVITTSLHPGTTLNLIDFELDGQSALYDTPGVVNRRQMAHLLTTNELKQTMPKTEIKPKVYQLSDRQTLFFAGLGRLDFVNGEARSFVCYFSNELYVHRTKLEKADEVYERNVGEMLRPPEKERKDRLPAFKKHDFTVKNKKVDVVFSGLGWVTVQPGTAQLSAYAPEGVGVSIRESLI